jgi:hypothetical protein
MTDIYESMIRQGRDHALFFERRFGGAAEVGLVEDLSAPLVMPYGFLVPMGETVSPNEALNGSIQVVRELYAVVVALDLTKENGQRDALGHAAVVARKQVKRALLGAFLNWRPDPRRMSRGLEYDGYDLVSIVGKVRAIYEFRFVAETLLTDDDGYQETLPNFEGFNASVDVLDPAFDPNNAPGQGPYDPSQPNPRTSGPDGRMETRFRVDLQPE